MFRIVYLYCSHDFAGNMICRDKLVFCLNLVLAGIFHFTLCDKIIIIIKVEEYQIMSFDGLQINFSNFTEWTSMLIRCANSVITVKINLVFFSEFFISYQEEKHGKPD